LNLNGEAVNGRNCNEKFAFRRQDYVSVSGASIGNRRVAANDSACLKVLRRKNMTTVLSTLAELWGRSIELFDPLNGGAGHQSTGHDCMYSWQLSPGEQKATPRIIEVLTAHGIQITGWKWKYISEVGEFYLLISSPSLHQLGPERVVEIQENVLIAANVDPRIVRRVRLIRG